MMEKHLRHKKELFHNFLDLKKAFDRVWHDGLWHGLRSFGIEEKLVQIMKSLHSSASSAVLLNNNASNYFRTTVGVRQGCLLSPILFNLYLENIMRETLHNFKSTISIGGPIISNLRFADDIDLMGGNNDELQELTDRLSNSAREYGMEISSEKSKVMVNSGDKITVQISMNGQQLEEVMAFKYLGATLTKDGRSTAEIKIRLAMATASMAKLNKIWSSKDVNFSTKIKLYKTLALSTQLYGCESWTLTADSTKRIQAFENECYRRMLGISWKGRKTNEFVQRYKGTSRTTRKPVRDSEKKKTCMVWPHFSPQQPGQNSAAGNSGGRKKARKTG